MDCLEGLLTLVDVMDHPLCPKCGHEVREHQPIAAAQPRGHALQRVGCLVCGCQLSMNQKLKAWGGPRK